MQISVEWLNDFIETPSLEALVRHLVECGIEVEGTKIITNEATSQEQPASLQSTTQTTILSLSVPANRPDLLSYQGIARELAARLGKRIRSIKGRLTEQGPDVNTQARLLVEDFSYCKKYSARVVRGIKVGPSPQWLKDRLAAIGQRSINNVVDVTNYVMFEQGHPLHAFDLSRIAVDSGLPTIKVRKALAGERLQTLDGIQRTLTADDIVVADQHRPLALAGVMGGKDSEVNQATAHLLIEAAHFDPVAVRLMSKRHQLRSEASYRFERGCDLQNIPKVLERCCQLLQEVSDGIMVSKGYLDMGAKLEPQREIQLRLPRIQKILGINLVVEQVVGLFEPLDIRFTGRTDSSLLFVIPGFRADLQDEIDLIEELARRVGYQQLPQTLPSAAESFVYRPVVENTVQQVRQDLLALGLSETISFGFTSPTLQQYLPKPLSHLLYAGDHAQKPWLTLMNPLGIEHSILRPNLYAGLLKNMQQNLHHGEEHVRLFEIGTVFMPRQAPTTMPLASVDTKTITAPTSKSFYAHEAQFVACVMQGGRHQGAWYEQAEPLDFSDLLGVVQLTIAHCGRGLCIPEKQDIPGYEPGVAAYLKVGEQVIGYAGMLSESLRSYWQIATPVFLAEWSLDGLIAQPLQQKRYKPIAKYPAARRDVAFIIPNDLAVASLQDFYREAAAGDLGSEVIEKLWIFDVYQGKNLPKNHRSVAFAIVYRSAERTLKEEEIYAAWMAGIEKTCKHFSIKIRDNS